MITHDFSDFSIPISHIRDWVEHSRGDECAIYLRGPVTKRNRQQANRRLRVAMYCHETFGAYLFQRKVPGDNNGNTFLYYIQPRTVIDEPDPLLQKLRTSGRVR